MTTKRTLWGWLEIHNVLQPPDPRIRQRPGHFELIGYSAEGVKTRGRGFVVFYTPDRFWGLAVPPKAWRRRHRVSA